MSKVDFRYQEYFNSLRAYHQLSPEKREKLVERMFTGIIYQASDPQVRARLNVFVAGELAKFEIKTG